MNFTLDELRTLAVAIQDVLDGMDGEAGPLSQPEENYLSELLKLQRKIDKELTE